MITTRTERRIDGVDTTGDRWGAQPRHGVVAIRTLGGHIHLDHADAASLAAWLLDAVEQHEQDPTR